MADSPPLDARRTGPASSITADVTPELLVCTALVRCGLVDGAGASLVQGPDDRIDLAATDETFVQVAEMQFSTWEGPGPEVVQSGLPVVVDDLHAQGARWPLTTPHAAATRMRALATLPLPTSYGVAGLFAVYRATPGPFTSTDMAQLQAAAATVGTLANARVDQIDLTLRAHAPTLAVAVGRVMARLDVEPDDALALLRAKAFALSISAPALARRLANGTAQIDDLLKLGNET